MQVTAMLSNVVGPMQEVEFMGVSAAFFAAHDLWMTWFVAYALRSFQIVLTKVEEWTWLLHNFGVCNLLLQMKTNGLGKKLDDMSFYAMVPLGLYFGIVQYKGWIKAGGQDVICEPTL